ncbi:hypothetical protein [Ralstonia pseudosolanacearum]|uniref:hypothetical protein n=1 Tax=Ralstonia pseudosolanacearum TaxID=1310165 RepID=UPI0018D02FEF|nr:hypothetical protein [Ralstonia pseudosolanacearum]
MIPTSKGGERSAVALSVALSPYLAKVLRRWCVDGNDALLTRLERAVAPLSIDDQETARRFRDGLEHGRLEVHGAYISVVTATLLGKLREFHDPAGLGYRVDSTFSDSDEEWCRMSERGQGRFIEEARDLASMASQAWRKMEGL